MHLMIPAFTALTASLGAPSFDRSERCSLINPNTWRMEQDKEQDAQVVTIDEVARPAVYALLDQFAVVSGAAAAKQGSSRSRYILAHGGVKPSERWRNVWEVAYRTLKKVELNEVAGWRPN